MYPQVAMFLQNVIFPIFRMTRLLLLVAGLAVAGEARRIQINEEVESMVEREVESLVGREVESLVGREGRGLAEWFGWGGSQATEAPVRRIQGLQRRTSQVEVSSTQSVTYLRGIQILSLHQLVITFAIICREVFEGPHSQEYWLTAKTDKD